MTRKKLLFLSAVSIGVLYVVGRQGRKRDRYFKQIDKVADLWWDKKPRSEVKAAEDKARRLEKELE